ncbi:MAG: DNA translocase FtsK, partial [Planctomycetes bacterium]|nr:DNA translocase FtsK [Planctomycetota bacterium]
EATSERAPLKVNPPVTVQTRKSARERLMDELEASSRVGAGDDHPLPGLDLLEEPEEFPYELLAKKARLSAITLEKTFREFGLNVKVAEVDTGPVITQFELELEAGLRLSKVTSLADDLAIALRVPSVRVVAPIPGKNTVGVEVPNEKRVMVRLKELIESCPDDVREKRIPVFLGKDVSGRPLVIDLTKMPHLLIAGRTGTGKSVCLNSLILSILMTRTPEQVKMLLIDPKMVELSPYKRIPHLMHPVITDMQKAEAVLAWAVDKMEERYDLLARCGVRHLDGYNKLGKDEVLRRLDIDPEDPEADNIPDQMPYIVIIADEMADLMMSCGKDVEGHIIRLAQKSRAVGIHLVLATQKPTVDVVTGLIKSNLPARISFQVASRSDSRVVLDETGADRLLGNGDMLYLAPGTSKLTRAQGTFVSDDEVQHVIDFFRDQDPQYSVELAQVTTSAAQNGKRRDGDRPRDELYDEAVEVVIREGRGSVSLLQRCLGIGYGRAARLIDYMAEDGIVGEYNGSQAREVLFTLEQWEAMKNQGAEQEEPEPAAV